MTYSEIMSGEIVGGREGGRDCALYEYKTLALSQLMAGHTATSLLRFLAILLAVLIYVSCLGSNEKRCTM